MHVLFLCLKTKIYCKKRAVNTSKGIMYAHNINKLFYLYMKIVIIDPFFFPVLMEYPLASSLMQQPRFKASSIHSV
ncbi:unnamed protein product, partial [Musa banksii]